MEESRWIETDHGLLYAFLYFRISIRVSKAHHGGHDITEQSIANQNAKTRSQTVGKRRNFVLSPLY